MLYLRLFECLGINKLPIRYSPVSTALHPLSCGPDSALPWAGSCSSMNGAICSAKERFSHSVFDSRCNERVEATDVAMLVGATFSGNPNFRELVVRNVHPRTSATNCLILVKSCL